LVKEFSTHILYISASLVTGMFFLS